MCVCGGGGAGVEGSKENRDVGRPFQIPAKMVEEGVAFPSLPTLPLPGKQGTWRLWLSSPVGNQTLEQMHSQTHTEKRIKLVFIRTFFFSPIWVQRGRVGSSFGF